MSKEELIRAHRLAFKEWAEDCYEVNRFIDRHLPMWFLKMLLGIRLAAHEYDTERNYLVSREIHGNHYWN